MKQSTIKFILLVLAQAALWNYFNVSPYLFVAYLPGLLLCLPPERSTLRVMLLAFLLGLVTDFFVNGQIGLTALALVPVAFFRRRLIRIVFGQEIFARGENLSFHRHGWAKFALAIALLTALFLLIYIWVDSAGMYSLGFRILKFVLSLLASTVVSLAVAYLYLEDSGERWK